MFSPREELILKVIGRKKVTIEYITNELYGDRYKRPFNSKIGVTNTIRIIIAKCEYNDLDWTLTKTRVNRKLIIKKGRR